MESDEALLIRGRNGQRSAFEELIRRTARAVFARIFLEIGDRPSAEDLTQETFLRAWRGLDRMNDPRGFRAWLFTIAHSVVVDHIRRGRRKKRFARRSDRDVANLAADSPVPQHAAECNEDRQTVLAALRAMPEEYRTPLMLKYFAGADYQAIERQMGITSGALRGLLYRGMEMLRKRVAVETRPHPLAHRIRQPEEQI